MKQDYHDAIFIITCTQPMYMLWDEVRRSIATQLRDQLAFNLTDRVVQHNRIIQQGRNIVEGTLTPIESSSNV